MRLFALILMLIVPTWGVAQKFNAEMRLTDLNPIYVSVNDFASGGCWTNLKEVKTYASDKLELGGGVLTDSLEEVLKGNAYALNILVNAKRHSTLGICYGNISIKTEGIGYGAKEPQWRGMISYSEKGANVTSSTNFNQQVLDYVGKALDEWR